MSTLPTDPISGQSGPYSPNYIAAASQVVKNNGSPVPYSLPYLQSLGINTTIPTVNDTNSGGTDTSGSGGATYLTSAPAPVSNWLPTDEAAYQQGVQIANNQLARIPSQLDVAMGNISSQYGQQNNALDSSKNAAQGQYDTSTTQNKQQFVTNKNTIGDEASQGLLSLQRLLGLHGAGGSSAYMFAAPEAVATHASQQRSGAGQTFAQNQQGLDTNWNNFLGDFKNKQAQLTDWRSQQEQQARSTADTNKQNLLASLAQLTGNRTAAQGGNGVAAEQPYIDQINGLGNEIDSLGRFNPTYSGTTPVYTPKSLDSYNIQQVAGPQTQGGSALTDATTPFLSLLLGQKKDQPLLTAGV